MLVGLVAGAVAGATAAGAAPAVPPKPDQTLKDGRARYQPNSPDIQNFYRVNRYPKDCGGRPC
jgi:hypothetical protein